MFWQNESYRFIYNFQWKTRRLQSTDGRWRASSSAAPTITWSSISAQPIGLRWSTAVCLLACKSTEKNKSNSLHVFTCLAKKVDLDIHKEATNVDSLHTSFSTLLRRRSNQSPQTRNITVTDSVSDQMWNMVTVSPSVTDIHHLARKVFSAEHYHVTAKSTFYHLDIKCHHFIMLSF